MHMDAPFYLRLLAARNLLSRMSKEANEVKQSLFKALEATLMAGQSAPHCCPL